MKIDIACSQCIALDVANHCNHTGTRYARSREGTADDNADDDLYNVADGSLFRSRPKASKLNRFKCSQCSKAYTRKANLVDHVQSEHSTEPVKYPCKKCSKTFLRMSDRNRHERNQHGDMRFVCGQQPDHEGDGCGIAFARLDALKEHRSTLKCAKSRRKAADQEYLIRRLDRLGNMLYEISAEAARSRSSSPDARVSGNAPSELRMVEAVLQLGDDTRYHESGSSDPSFWAGWRDRRASGKDSPHAATKATQELPAEPTLSSQAQAQATKAERLRQLRSDFKSQYPEIVNPGPADRDHTSNDRSSSVHAASVTVRSILKSDLTVARNEDDGQVNLATNGWQGHRRQEDAGNEPIKPSDVFIERDTFLRLAQADHLHLLQSIESIVKPHNKIPNAAAVNVQSYPGMHAAVTEEQATPRARSRAHLPQWPEQLAYFGQGHRLDNPPSISSSLTGALPMEPTGLYPSVYSSSDLLDVMERTAASSPPLKPVSFDTPNNALDMLLAASKTFVR